MSGMEIAGEISAALAEAGHAVGDGPMAITLRKAGAGAATPWDADPGNAPTLHDLVAIEEYREIRDAKGSLVGQTVRTLTVEATGAAPEKADRVAVGVAKAAVGPGTEWVEVIAVRPLSPSGVALLYEVDLAD